MTYLNINNFIFNAILQCEWIVKQFKLNYSVCGQPAPIDFLHSIHISKRIDPFIVITVI